MIKVMSIADIHLVGGPETDEAQALMRAADVALAHGVGLVLVNGDVFHSKSTPAQRLVFKRFLDKLVGNQVEVVVLRGNHDEKDDLKVFDCLGVYVFEEPTPQPFILTVDMGMDEPKDIAIHTIPHYNAAALAQEAESQVQMGDTGTGLYDQLLNGIFQSVRSMPEYPHIVAFHGTVTGAHLDNGMIPKHDGIVLNGPLLSSIGCPVRGGHYHKRQSDHPNVWYSGSITLRNYGESGDKGVLIDTWNGEKWLDPEFVSLNPPPRITIEVEWSADDCSFWISGLEDGYRAEFTTVAQEYGLSYKNARVRFRYSVKQSEIATVNLEPVRQFFEAAGVRELKIERDLINETAVRSESIHQAHTVLDMHSEWLKLKGLDDRIPAQEQAYKRHVEGITA